MLIPGVSVALHEWSLALGNSFDNYLLRVFAVWVCLSQRGQNTVHLLFVIYYCNILGYVLFFSLPILALIVLYHLPEGNGSTR